MEKVLADVQTVCSIYDIVVQLRDSNVIWLRTDNPEQMYYMDCCLVFWDLWKAGLANYIFWLKLERSVDKNFTRNASWSFTKSRFSLNHKVLCASSKLSLYMCSSDGNTRNVSIWGSNTSNVLVRLKAQFVVPSINPLWLVRLLENNLVFLSWQLYMD